MGRIRRSLGNSERNLGHDSGLEQGIWSQRTAPVVEDFDHRFRTDKFAVNFGPDRVSGNALWQPVRDEYRSLSRLAFSPRFLAHHAVVGHSNPAPLGFAFVLPLPAKFNTPSV